VWAPVFIKGGGIALGLFTLAGIGLASTWASSGGAPIVERAFAANNSDSGHAPESPSEPRSSISHGGVRARSRLPAPNTPLMAEQAGAALEADGSACKVKEKVVLNLATVDQLTALPGVGHKRARAILELRARLNGFKRVTDLLRIRGIGPRSLKRMKPCLVLDAAGPADAGARD
jgi:competence protein ComEA